MPLILESPKKKESKPIQHNITIINEHDDDYYDDYYDDDGYTSYDDDDYYDD